MKLAMRTSMGCATNSSLDEISEMYLVVFLFRLERRLNYLLVGIMH
jgi:hypothetical protein